MTHPTRELPASSQQPPDLFATTRWTVVITAGAGTTPAAEAALQELCQTYWYPLYAYVRRQGLSREDAQDLTQSFFERTLSRTDFGKLDSEQGRFRAFLLAAMKHFLANEWDKSRALKRGGGITHLRLDWQDADSLYRDLPADSQSPDKLYDRTWALTLLERVIARLREECLAEGNGATFNCLKDFLTLEAQAISYDQAAAAAGLTPSAARVAVHRLRKRYRTLLRAEIAQTLCDSSLVEDEMRTLYLAFAQ